jgi:hypothetical protein
MLFMSIDHLNYSMYQHYEIYKRRDCHHMIFYFIEAFYNS